MVTDIIRPSEIQAELKRIWDTLEGSNKIRASLFNLIFFTKKCPRAEYIRTISQTVIEKFPSRVIFITADTTVKEEYLNTRVLVIPSSSDIVCDYIQIDVSGKLQDRVPFVILPHILPDLPIYVIWAEDPSEATPLFSQLQQLATRMIFDSEAVSNLSLFAQNLLNFEKQFQCDIADLNWARTESWRQLLASTFYTQERLDLLKASTQIQILYNAQESAFTHHTEVQAIYLQGWLATQLNWKLEKMKNEKGKVQLIYQREGGQVEVSLYPEALPNLKSGIILSIDIETADQSHFSFGRNLDQPHTVSMRFSTLVKCDIPLQYLFAKEESGGSLVKEICHRGTSHHYLNLLRQMKDRAEFSFGEH